MAENRTYKIEINAQGAGKKANAKNAISGNNKKSDNETDNSTGGLLNKEQAKGLAIGMTTYHILKSFATQAVNYEVSVVELRTGSNRLQQKANFTSQVVQQGVGIMENIAMGALVGGLPGAVAGLTLSTAHTIIGYAQNANRLSLQKSVENESLEMQFIRAGARGSRVE